METLLKIEDLHLEVGGRKILNGLNFSVNKGEVSVLFGPNGAGKSSLLYAILGFPGYKATKGKIYFKGKDITSLPINERVKLGIGLSFQAPPAIRGIKLKEMVRVCNKSLNDEQVQKLSEEVNMDSFLSRDVNLGFSGGEAKRAEMLQMLAQKPDLTLFDEPDSGVDLENVQLIGKKINDLLKGKTGLIITHQGYILQFIKATKACVLYDGIIRCHGSAEEILKDIQTKGYAGCVLCQTPKEN